MKRVWRRWRRLRRRMQEPPLNDLQVAAHARPQGNVTVVGR